MKKTAWKRYLANRNEENYEEYKKQRKGVKVMIVEAKKKSWEDYGHKLEEDSKGNQKLFYKILKELRQGKEKKDIYIKNTKGELLTEETEIIERWKQYFQDLLQSRDDIMEEEITERVMGEENGDEEIKQEEIEDAIKWLKNGKAPGIDKITPEMIKNMGEEGRQLFLKICNKAWYEKTVPRDWEVALILPIHKKGDPKQCSNYRGISLLCTSMKVYEKILDNRLRKEIDSQLNEAQSGFRKGRSIQDHIFTVQQIIDKTLQQGNEAFFAFIDLEKAFDKVKRTKIWESLQNKKVNKELINAIKSTYKNTINYVITKNMRSEPFTTVEGVRQGGGLSPFLFTIFMDDIIQKCTKRVKKLTVGYRNLQRVQISEGAFADDVVVMAGKEEDLQINLEIWNQVLQEHGMNLNKEKTKVMAVGTSREINIYIDNTKIQRVNSFQYLGVEIQDNGEQEVEINRRTEKAMNIYYAMSRSFINKKEIARSTKLNVYRTVFRPVLTFGCETWVLTKRQKSKLQAAEMKYLRRVRGVTKIDKMRNIQIRKDLEVQSVTDFIEQRQLSWWGHLNRMESRRPVKQVWEAKIHKKRKRGRPRKTWDKAIGEVLQKRGSNWNEARTTAKNKKEWRKFVYQ